MHACTHVPLSDARRMVSLFATLYDVAMRKYIASLRRSVDVRADVVQSPIGEKFAWRVPWQTMSFLQLPRAPHRQPHRSFSGTPPPPRESSYIQRQSLRFPHLKASQALKFW